MAQVLNPWDDLYRCIGQYAERPVRRGTGYGLYRIIPMEGAPFSICICDSDALSVDEGGYSSKRFNVFDVDSVYFRHSGAWYHKVSFV